MIIDKWVTVCFCGDAGKKKKKNEVHVMAHCSLFLKIIV